MTQSKAYETLLRIAAERRWIRVYNLMMRDGFLAGMDYVELLEMWKADGL